MKKLKDILETNIIENKKTIKDLDSYILSDTGAREQLEIENFYFGAVIRKMESLEENNPKQVDNIYDLLYKNDYLEGPNFDEKTIKDKIAEGLAITD